MKRIVAYLLVLVMGFPLSMWSQSQGANPTEVQEKKLLEDEPAAKSEVQKLGAGEGSRVRVTLRNTTEVKGYISQIDADTFQVTDRKSGHVRTVAYQDVTKVHRGGGMSSGAKIAIVGGIGCHRHLGGSAFPAQPLVSVRASSLARMAGRKETHRHICSATHIRGAP